MLQIDFYTEITCPWCIIGHHRLDKVLAERFPELDVDIRQPGPSASRCAGSGSLHSRSSPLALWRDRSEGVVRAT